MFFNYIPSPNQKKKKSAALWGNDDVIDNVIDDEIDDETYDEIAVKTASKCFTHMKDCWDPEFEPSVEEIVDYRWDSGYSPTTLSLYTYRRLKLLIATS